FILPEGEYFMVNTMRELLPKITDEQLKEEMMIFIEEEENHAIVTTRYYQMLQNHGYDVNKQKQAAHDFFKKLNRKTPEERIVLSTLIESITAGLGLHYLNEVSPPEVNEKMVRLLHWHGAEELAHRSLCAKVHRHLHGRHKRMPLSTFPLLLGCFFFVLKSAIMQLRDKKQLFAFKSV